MAATETGEFALIRRLADVLGGASKGAVLGIGDDTAVLAPSGAREILVTADALVEGVHFDRRYTPLEDLGWKSLAASVSDVAAMGGTPTSAVITLALDARWSPEDVERLYQGLSDCAAAYQVVIAGGDTTRSLSGAFINITLLGTVEPGHAVTRSGGRPGDWLGVTGVLGGARCGLEALSSGLGEGYPLSTKHFLRPQPSVAAGQWLARSLKATAMIDISDGLASELGHICDGSGTGCIVEAVPVAEEARLWTEVHGHDAIDFALSSGEEYQLLFACPPEMAHSEIVQDCPVPIHWIGRLTAKDEARILVVDGRQETLEARGWDHFRA